MYLTAKKYWPIILLIDLFGYILFFWKRFSSIPKFPRKVLFIRLEHIGDMVMSTPVFETWKINYPNCEVHVLCKTITAPIIENNPNVDKIITYDTSWMIKREEDKKKSFSGVLKILRKEKYDIVFEMHGDPRNNFLATIIGGYSVGYGCRGGGFLLNKTTSYDTSKHNILQNLEIIKPYCTRINKETTFYTDNKSIQNCSRLMNKYALKKNKFIIINPLSGRIEKNLTTQEVQKFINKYKRYTIVLTGTKSDHKNNKIFEKQNVINMCGETDLLTLTELVKNAKLVIAPDTGIIHIAKAVGTDFECIYKTTDLKVWGYK